MSEESLAQAARRLAQTLIPGDLDHTLARITAAAVEVLPGVDYASLTIRHVDGRLETIAPTDDLLYDIDAAQYQLQEGPCYDSATDTVHVTAPHLATDDRFPRYRDIALSAGIRAQAGIRLFDAPKSQGALNLYSHDEGAFADLGVIGDFSKHQAAMAIEYAQEIHHLQEALQTRKTVGLAVGIVMERYELSEDRAFAFLARLSQAHDVKLLAVAKEMIRAHDDKVAAPDRSTSRHLRAVPVESDEDDRGRPTDSSE